MKPSAKKTLFLLSCFHFLLWAFLGLLAPVELLFLDSITDSVVVKGILMSIPGLVLFLVSPLVTRVSGFVGRKKSMITLLLFSAPFYALLPVAQSELMYGLLRAFSSALLLAMPIFLAYTGEAVKRKGLGYGVLLLASSFGGAFGFLLSGVLGQYLSLSAPYYLVTGLALVSLGFIVPLDEIVQRKKEIHKKVYFSPLVIAVLANSFLFSLHLSSRGVLWPLVLENISASPALYAGIIFAGMGIVAGLLSVHVGLASEKYGSSKVFYLGWLVMGLAGIALYFATENLIPFMLFSFVFAIGETIKGPSGQAILAEANPTLFGYQMSIGSLGMLLGPLVSGVLVVGFGTQLTIFFLGLVVIGSLVPFVIRKKK